MRFFFVSPLILLPERSTLIYKLPFLVVARARLAQLLAPQASGLPLVAFDAPLPAPVAGPLGGGRGGGRALLGHEVEQVEVGQIIG